MKNVLQKKGEEKLIMTNQDTSARIKTTYPESAFSLYFIRCMILQRSIPLKRSGNKVLLNSDEPNSTAIPYVNL